MVCAGFGLYDMLSSGENAKSMSIMAFLPDDQTQSGRLVVYHITQRDDRQFVISLSVLVRQMKAVIDVGNL